ncbi:MAG: four helix bundle protein [Campylobacterota bacterium]|nr:four helix bundle protein [Campylobacterota bacterium]
MQYDNLPIYKSSMDFCAYIETIVKTFGKYEKYTIGEDLRNYSKEILFLIHKANISFDKKENLELLRDKCEQMKMLIHLCKELKSFKSFKQFEHSSKMIVGIAKQSQSWLNHYARVSK